MKTPDIIYLQTCGDCCGQDCENCDFDTLEDVTWCKDKISDSDTAYFSEEAVRKLADQFALDADLVIARLQGKTFSEYLKGGEQ